MPRVGWAFQRHRRDGLAAHGGALMSWWAIVAACGFAQRLFATPRPWVRAVSKGVFCAYILHQTVIVLLTQALRFVALPWGLEALLVLLLTFGPVRWPA